MNMIHLVQISNGSSRRVAVVEEPHLRCLREVETVYELVHRCLSRSGQLSRQALGLADGEVLDYNAIYAGTSDWHLLAPIDVPGVPSKLTISGTGLTHLGSAKERQAMHIATVAKAIEDVTDSMRMFQWGVEGGRPMEGAVGVAPEWFYKGNGSMLRAPLEPLTIPAYAEDGGEEGELAGIYVIDSDGTPFRIGMTAGNEFSDHRFEKRNYLNLAGSKLRTCSLGPELVVDPEFESVSVEVNIERNGQALWSTKFRTGQAEMCHSLQNMEHHHFKFASHRRPGDIHVHFFGTDCLSFGAGVHLENGDVMQ